MYVIKKNIELCLFLEVDIEFDLFNSFFRHIHSACVQNGLLLEN